MADSTDTSSPEIPSIDSGSTVNCDYELSLDQNRLRENVIEIYQTVWNEFYHWYYWFCQKELESLPSGIDTLLYESEEEAEIWELGDRRQVDRPSPAIPHVSYNGTEEETVDIFDHKWQESTREYTVKKLKWVVHLAPFPPYQFCKYLERPIPSYATREQAVVDEEGKEKPALWLEFCPFTDERGRVSNKWRKELMRSGVAAWEQCGIRDNNVDVIMMETGARLKRMGVSLKEVDNLQALPRPFYDVRDEIGSEMGLLNLWKGREAVFPEHWEIARGYPKEDLINENHFHDLVLTYCSICEKTQCIMHPQQTNLLNDLWRRDKLPPSVPKAQEPCGDLCALIYPLEDKSDPLFDQNQLQVMKTMVVGLASQGCPTACIVGATMNLPCWAVQRQMELLIAENRIEPQPQLRHRLPSRKVDNFNFETWKPHQPCVHDGPCDGCECAEYGGWCYPSCRCAKNCYRRPPGCSCDTRCETSSCPCRKASRECQPGLCRKCVVEPSGPTFSCVNNAIQRNLHAKTEVRPSTHGWGLFATEEILAGDLVNIYTGEMHSQDTHQTRKAIADVLKRNYNFALSKHTEIDAMYGGNETRMINDPRADPSIPADRAKVNCRVPRIWVQGDPYLAVVASRDIMKGEELFLNYGDEFFWGKKRGKPKIVKEKEKRHRI